MPIEMKMTVRCDRCQAEASTTEHDNGDFWSFLRDLNDGGWIIRATHPGDTGKKIICPACWQAEHGEGRGRSYRCMRQPEGDRTENIYTMPIRRCGEIAKALGFQIYITQNLSADHDGDDCGVWGLMVRSDDGQYLEMSLDRLVEHFPHYCNVTFKVQNALSHAANKLGSAYVTYDDPDDSDAKNIIVFPYGVEIPPQHGDTRGEDE
jgi:hypothetical protein